MAIIKVLSRDELVKAFDDYNRGDNFSIKARRRLYDYFWDLSEGLGQNYTLDVIAVCCDWSEYTLDELVHVFGHMVDDLEHFEEIVERLEEYTTVLEVEHYGKENTYLVQVF